MWVGVGVGVCVWDDTLVDKTGRPVWGGGSNILYLERVREAEWMVVVVLCSMLFERHCPVTWCPQRTHRDCPWHAGRTGDWRWARGGWLPTLSQVGLQVVWCCWPRVWGPVGPGNKGEANLGGRRRRRGFARCERTSPARAEWRGRGCSWRRGGCSVRASDSCAIDCDWGSIGRGCDWRRRGSDGSSGWQSVLRVSLHGCGALIHCMLTTGSSPAGRSVYLCLRWGWIRCFGFLMEKKKKKKHFDLDFCSTTNDKLTACSSTYQVQLIRNAQLNCCLHPKVTS